MSAEEQHQELLLSQYYKIMGFENSLASWGNLQFKHSRILDADLEDFLKEMVQVGDIKNIRTKLDPIVLDHYGLFGLEKFHAYYSTELGQKQIMESLSINKEISLATKNQIENKQKIKPKLAEAERKSVERYLRAQGTYTELNKILSFEECAQIYLKHFSTRELDELAQYYETEGQKDIDKVFNDRITVAVSEIYDPIINKYLEKLK